MPNGVVEVLQDLLGHVGGIVDVRRFVQIAVVEILGTDGRDIVHDVQFGVRSPSRTHGGPVRRGVVEVFARPFQHVAYGEGVLTVARRERVFPRLSVIGVAELGGKVVRYTTLSKCYKHCMLKLRFCQNVLLRQFLSPQSER